MRYKPTPRYQFERTRLKDLAAERKLRKERDAFPLFAADIAASQPTVEEIMAKRELACAESEREHRARRARGWREVRRELYSVEPTLRAVILEEWNHHRWYPGDPYYLACLIKKRLKERGNS